MSAKNSENVSKIPTVVAQIYKGRKVLLEHLERQGFETDQYRNFSVNDIHAMTRFNCLDMLVTGTNKNREKVKCYVKYQNDSGKALKAPEVDMVIEDLFTTEYNDLEQNDFHRKYQDEIVLGALEKPSLTRSDSEVRSASNSAEREIEGVDCTTVLRANKDVLVYVLFSEPNGALINRLKALFDRDGILVVPFNITRLQFNITSHVLVPLHTILSEEEVQTEIVEALGFKNGSVQTLISGLPEISRFDPVASSILMRPGQVCRIERTSTTAVNSIYYRVCV